MPSKRPTVKTRPFSGGSVVSDDEEEKEQVGDLSDIFSLYSSVISDHMQPHPNS